MRDKLIVSSVLACWLASVGAEPISFTSTQFFTNTIALTASLADADSDSSPPSATPLITTSTVFDANDFASGTAFAAAGSLLTSAEADSAAGFSSAVGSTEFIGSFTALRPMVTLSLDFNTNDSTDSSDFSAGSLFLRLTSGGSTLFNEVFVLAGPIEQTIAIPLGAVGTLDILLVSEASTVTGGSAFNIATVTFSAAAVAIPEPATLFLLGSGFVGVAWARRRKPQ